MIDRKPQADVLCTDPLQRRGTPDIKIPDQLVRIFVGLKLEYFLVGDDCTSDNFLLSFIQLLAVHKKPQFLVNLESTIMLSACRKMQDLCGHGLFWVRQSLLGSVSSRKWVVALVLCHRKWQIVSRAGQMEGKGEKWRRWIRGL